MVKTGRYRHYKGNEYQVIGCARHSETEEEFVVYQALYGDHGLWIRPTAMFVEEVEKEGNRMPRFKLLEEKSRKDKGVHRSGSSYYYLALDLVG